MSEESEKSDRITIDCPARPGAAITTSFGHDVDPILKVYRFHRAIDRADGDRQVYCPIAARRALLEAPSGPAYGTLVRLVYDGFEIRLAHCKDFSEEFVSLVAQKKPIPSGMIIAAEGSLGKSTGPHTHIELVALGEKRVPALDAALAESGGVPGKWWTGPELSAATDGRYLAWKEEYAAKQIGPHECVAWDRRTNGWALWMDPLAVLGL